MSFNFKQEFNRKLIHLSSAIYPISYLFFTKEIMIIVVSMLFALILLWDIHRITGYDVKIISLFDKFIRAKESQRFIGATYFLASILLVIILFPKNIAIVSIFILVFCDTAAALVGKVFGRTKIKSLNKSIEGFVAFNIVGFIIITIYLEIVHQSTNYTLYLLSFLTIFVTALVELFSDKFHIDDNFSITLVSATCLYFLYR